MKATSKAAKKVMMRNIKALSEAQERIVTIFAVYGHPTDECSELCDEYGICGSVLLSLIQSGMNTFNEHKEAEHRKLEHHEDE